MNFSIIICTYNPDSRIIERAIKSVNNLIIPEETTVEFILVDNNSNNNFQKLFQIEKLLSNFKIIVEHKQGLSNARITGVKNSKNNIIIFVDDDNELDKNYLVGLKNILNQFSQVGIWGPSIINVDFIDGADNWIKKYMLTMFQDKQVNETKYGCEIGWKNYYPVGSGIVIKKEIFNDYISLYEKGELTITGRKGENLSSGEDAQIIWTAVKKSIPLGTSEVLKLNHIIPKKRTTLPYLVNLNFNLSYSFYKGQYEMFQDKKLLELSPNILTNLKLFLITLLKCNFNIVNTLKVYKVNNAWYKGYKLFYNQFQK